MCICNKIYIYLYRIWTSEVYVFEQAGGEWHSIKVQLSSEQLPSMSDQDRLSWAHIAF